MTTQPCLTILGGPLEGQRFLLEPGTNSVSIGSDPACAIHIPLPTLGAIHARVWLDEQGATLYANAPGGVYVNGTRVTAARPLKNGDVMKMGRAGAQATIQFLHCVVPLTAASGLGAASAPEQAAPPPIAGLEHQEPPAVAEERAPAASLEAAPPVEVVELTAEEAQVLEGLCVPDTAPVPAPPENEDAKAAAPWTVETAPLPPAYALPAVPALPWMRTEKARLPRAAALAAAAIVAGSVLTTLGTASRAPSAAVAAVKVAAAAPAAALPAPLTSATAAQAAPREAARAVPAASGAQPDPKTAPAAQATHSLPASAPEAPAPTPARPALETAALAEVMPGPVASRPFAALLAGPALIPPAPGPAAPATLPTAPRAPEPSAPRPRRFVVGRTVATGAGSVPSEIAGFETSGLKLAPAPEIAGRLEVAVNPPRPRPGQPYTLQVHLVNDGHQKIKLADVALALALDGKVTAGARPPLVKEVAPGGRALVDEFSAVWPAEGVKSWGAEVAVRAKNGDRLRTRVVLR